MFFRLSPGQRENIVRDGRRHGPNGIKLRWWQVVGSCCFHSQVLGIEWDLFEIITCWGRCGKHTQSQNPAPFQFFANSFLQAIDFSSICGCVSKLYKDPKIPGNMNHFGRKQLEFGVPPFGIEHFWSFQHLHWSVSRYKISFVLWCVFSLETFGNYLFTLYSSNCESWICRMYQGIHEGH